MKIRETQKFRRSLDSINPKIRKKAKKQFQLFLKNLFYPSLYTEKLEPKDKNLWSFRVNRSYRVIFTFIESEIILLLDIGPHDIYRRH